MDHPSPSPLGPTAPAGAPHLPPEIVVAVLGPVEVRGAARPFRRAWTLDLVAYLAMHPRGARNDAWATALWPDRLMAPATLHSTASAARRALGHSGAGHDHLPHGHGRLALAPTVSTDWQQLVAGAASGDPARWEEALALVRGRPFDGLASPDWTVLEGVAAEVDEAVVGLAERLAEHRLTRGDGVGAARAARTGLRASPYDERLYRVLLRAADQVGNAAGVETVMAELLLVMGEPEWRAGPPRPGPATPAGPGDAARRRGADPAPAGLRPAAGRPAPALADAMGAVHPQTADLYRSLSRRHHPLERVGGGR